MRWSAKPKKRWMYMTLAGADNAAVAGINWWPGISAKWLNEIPLGPYWLAIPSHLVDLAYNEALSVRRPGQQRYNLSYLAHNSVNKTWNP